MNNFIKLIVNTTTFIFVLIINYLSNTDLIGTSSVGEISNRYPTAITPAGYAFSIWGLIYLLLSLFLGYQWFVWKKQNGRDLIGAIGYYFTLSNLANILWIITWVNDRIGLSLICIGLLMGSLILLIQRLNLERWNAPPAVILFVWWPIVVYFGWILIATILNVNVLLVSAGGDRFLWGASIRGIIFVVIATIIYIYLIYTRNLHESALVGVWGFIAIAYQQADESKLIQAVVIVCSVVLLANTIYHAFRNRRSIIA